MDGKAWGCAAVIALWSVMGFCLWGMAGCPEHLLHTCVLGGAACGAMYAAVKLVRRRNAERARVAAAAAEGCPEDRVRAPRAPGTKEQRTRDLRACYEGYITVDDYLDRWSGRTVVDDVPRARRPGRRSSPHAALFREVFGDQELTRRCMGLYEPVSGETPFVEAAERAASVAYRPGVKVRVRCGESAGRIMTLLSPKDGVPGVWNLDFGGGRWVMNEHAFELARPKKGEVWNKKACARCSPDGLEPANTLTDIAVDWNIVSEETARRIECGCFYVVGTQDAKP